MSDGQSDANMTEADYEVRDERRRGENDKATPLIKMVSGTSHMMHHMTKTFDLPFRPANSWEEALRAIFEENLALMLRKDADYGTSGILLTGEIGVAVRAQDKLSRLHNLLKKGGDPAVAESLDDTWNDLMNYALIARTLRNGTYNHPHRKEPDPPLTQNSAQATKDNRDVLIWRLAFNYAAQLTRELGSRGPGELEGVAGMAGSWIRAEIAKLEKME